MNLKNRLTLHFLLNLGLLFVCVCLVTVFSTYVYLFKFVPARNSIGQKANDILREMPTVTVVQAGRVSVSGSELQKILPEAWLQVLDEHGNTIFEYHVPAGVPRTYSPGQLVYDRAYPERFHYNLFTWYDTIHGRSLTWLYGGPFQMEQQLQYRQFVFLGILFAGSLFATLIVGLVFGRRLGAPLLHMMSWLQNIARGKWDEPKGEDGTPKSISPWTGQLRGPFRLYREVMEALRHLAQTLARGEESRIRLEKTREEWITGVSHDLKTPLSSVQGYATLLSHDGSTWSHDEVIHFGEIIRRQASYMEELLNDLSLIFRIRNESLPLSVTETDIVELVRRGVIDLMNHPNTDKDVSFDSSSEWIRYPVDAKWFKRAIDNFLANASLHNPPGTNIHVTIEEFPSLDMIYPRVSIRIADNGVGMDPETVVQMFDRYFRGMNTSDAEGRGSGLGCAIAKQLIDIHSGTIHVKTALGAGTTIEITLPSRGELTV